MKTINQFIISAFLLIPVSAVAMEPSNATLVQESETINSETVEKNSWGGKYLKSPFSIGLDVQTKYMWRGMEMLSDESAPVLFPTLNYIWNGLSVYVMGGYAINGKYAEVDAGISYTWKSLTLGVNDYYYPTIDNKEDKYLRMGKHTGHWLEACLTYAPEKIPFWATLSNFFYGADKYIDSRGKEKQAYSTYLELGTYYDFLLSNRISLAVGSAFNKSCYNGYEHVFSVVNLELKYTYNVEFKSGWTLPLNVAYIYNPVFDKSYVNFTANLAF
ncbi:MAG: hypothetical protein K2G91_07710 [Prevotella sp.]|nr:hypothetical protein [Prevotella sp.]